MKTILGLLLLAVLLYAENYEKLGDQAYEANNIKKAIEYYKEAANQGWVSSEYKLGFIYEHRGEIYASKAWYEKAALHGVAEAQFVLGLFYAEGTSFDYSPKSDKQALFWWKKAYFNGHQRAANNINILCNKQPALCR